MVSPRNGVIASAICWTVSREPERVVPAKVAGSYKIPAGELVLKQNFQMLSGTLKTDGKTVVVHGKVHGEDVSFTANGQQYHGHLSGKQLILDH